LPVRQRTAPRPELVVPKPPPRLPKGQPGNGSAAASQHPADARADAHTPKSVSKGGLQGAGGVSKTAVRLRETPEQAMARKDEARERGKALRDKRSKDRAAASAAAEAPRETTITMHSAIVVKDLAEKLGLRPNQVIMELMKMGVLASINQTVDADTAAKIAAAHGVEVIVERSRRNAEAKPVMRDPGADDEIPEDRPDQLVPRPPVVTFLGHVDHGKTTLMDYIRKAHVAAGEAGGITQAISAYTVDVQGRKITFLDTPGHAAFSAMRARGANLTDIAVIIIAADDGIMPQTREAIQQARDAHVTIMVAINKCDLPAANPMRVMQQLQAESLTPEEWGGTTVVCQVSGATGDGVGNLLDMISLQADVLELSANPNRRANGSVIEAQMAPGSGPVVSVLVTGGTLNVGDVVLCGEYYGRVRALTDSTGKRLKSAGPSAAVSIMGLSGVPEPGAEFRVMKNERRARELAEREAQRRKEETLGGVTQARSADEIFKQMHDADKLTLNLIVRADVQGSVEAILGAIADIKSSKVSCNVIQSGTGAIAVNDIERAGHGSAIVVGFNVSPESGVNALARHDGVRIQTFRIIYELVNFVTQEMLALLPVEHREAVRGHAVVKQVFDMGKEGVVAGSLVMDGFVTSKGQFRVTRRGKLVHTGGVESIRHFKEVVEEVKAAQECGIKLDGFRDVEEGDVLECFVFEELPKTL
ncbi:MAG: translation initiation factor IF-2, partial [Kiritimatiellae bacterium]|nr:translation initiation factor IF-2 [Kiritimatiellia bacterium]